MKRFLPLLAALALIFALAGCAVRPEEESAPLPPQSQPIPVPDELPALPPEPPILDWIADLPCPDFLDADQQDLYLRACTAFQFLTLSPDLVESFPLADGSRLEQDGDVPHETLMLDGLEYTRSMGRFCRWDDFQTMLNGLFTTDYQQQLLRPDGGPARFTSDGDGGMCYLNGSRDASTPYRLANIPDRFELVSRDDSHICFDLIGHYADLAVSKEGQEELGPVTTQAFPIRMTLTQEGWRFEEFHLPY